MTWFQDEKEKWYFYILCIFYDQKCDFPAVTDSQKYIFPTEQICFHSVPIEMIRWFWSTPSPGPGRELLRWLPWFQTVFNLAICNSRLPPSKSFLPLTYSPAHCSLIHHSLSLSNRSIFFSITGRECQCCNLFVIRTIPKIHLFFTSFPHELYRRINMPLLFLPQTEINLYHIPWCDIY